MKEFADESGTRWTATAREEETPRHHTRWYLVIEGPEGEFPVPEVRWQTRATAERTLRAMSEFELQRRLRIVRERARLARGASPDRGATREIRDRTSANAG